VLQVLVQPLQPLYLADKTQLILLLLKKGRYLGSYPLSHLGLKVECLAPLCDKALPGQDAPDQQQWADGQTDKNDDQTGANTVVHMSLLVRVVWLNGDFSE
jgi:hypothetical protein